MRKSIPVMLLGLTGLSITSCVTKTEMQKQVAEAQQRGYDSALRETEAELQALRAIKEVVKKGPKTPGPIGHTHDIVTKVSVRSGADSIPLIGTMAFVDKTAHQANNHSAIVEYTVFVNNKSLKKKELEELSIPNHKNKHKKINVVELELPDPRTGQPSGAFMRIAYFE